MDPIKKIDKMWSKQMKELEKAWNKEYQLLREEYSRHLASLEDEIGDLNKKIEEYTKDYETTIKELKAKYEEEAKKLAAEIKGQYENDRKELEAASEELREAKERYENVTSELEEFRSKVEEAAETIENEFENATRLLKEDVDKRCARIFSLVDAAEAEDEHLDEHSLGEVSKLRKNVSDIKYRSESDRYYHFSEMLMLGRRLSDYVNDVDVILERAKAVNEKEKAMTEIKRRIDGHLKKKRYRIIERQQETPWASYHVRFHDMQGNVYGIFAYETTFEVEVWPSRQDKRVKKELERAITNEISALYGDDGADIERNDTKIQSTNKTKQQTGMRTRNNDRKEAY